MAASTHRSNLGEHQLVPQSDDVDYVALASDELFQALKNDPNLLADDKVLFDLLKKRKNKKNDFKAVLLYINGSSNEPSVPKELRAVFREINSVTYCNSDELVLLTELAFRSKIMTGQHNNEMNNKRCVELAEQLGRSSSRAWIKGIVVTVLFPVIFAGIFLASAYPIMHLLSTYHVFQTFLLSFNNLLYASFGISSFISFFSTGYAINRLRSSNELNTISLATHEFFFSRNNAVRDEKADENAPPLNQLKSGELFQSLELNADWLANNDSLFRVLKRRENKKLDLLAALSYLKTHLAIDFRLSYSPVEEMIYWVRSAVYNGNHSSTELALLTELAYRMTKKYNAANSERCLVIAAKLEKASSPWAACIGGFLTQAAYVAAATSLTAFLFMSVPSVVAAFYALTVLTWSITYLCNELNKAKNSDAIAYYNDEYALGKISLHARLFASSQPAEVATASFTPAAITGSASAVPLVSVSISGLKG